MYPDTSAVSDFGSSSCLALSLEIFHTWLWIHSHLNVCFLLRFGHLAFQVPIVNLWDWNRWENSILFKRLSSGVHVFTVCCVSKPATTRQLLYFIHVKLIIYLSVGSCFRPSSGAHTLHKPSLPISFRFRRVSVLHSLSRYLLIIHSFLWLPVSYGTMRNTQ